MVKEDENCCSVESLRLGDVRILVWRCMGILGARGCEGKGVWGSRCSVLGGLGFGV